MIFVQLFLSFLQVGLFSVGGGYAAIPLIQNQVVELHPWLSLQEFTDLVTIAEMTPGPIAVNSATFVGIRIAGIPGAIIATLGCITPAIILVSLLAYIYGKYQNLSVLQNVLSCLRPAVVALIAVPVLSLARGMHPALWVVVVLVALAVWGLGWSPVLLIIAGAVAGIAWTLTIGKKARS